MLTTNLGFALTTIGARQEARSALESGFSLADCVFSGRNAGAHAAAQAVKKSPASSKTTKRRS